MKPTKRDREGERERENKRPCVKARCGKRNGQPVTSVRILFHETRTEMSLKRTTRRSTLGAFLSFFHHPLQRKKRRKTRVSLSLTFSSFSGEKKFEMTREEEKGPRDSAVVGEDRSKGSEARGSRRKKERREAGRREGRRWEKEKREEEKEKETQTTRSVACGSSTHDLP